MDSLSHLSDVLISQFEKDEPQTYDKKIIVNPVVSKVASLYEKFRNVMDYREEEVILRASIERILKRRILWGGKGKTIAEPLIRELVWARYFPDESISESLIFEVEREIDLHLELRQRLVEKKEFPEKTINQWIYHLMSSSIALTLNPNKKKEAMTNFMFHVIRGNISITDDTEQNKDVQVFIAVRKNFAKDDLAFIRFHLFNQFFGKLNQQNLSHVAANFNNCYNEISSQLNYSRKDKVYNYVKGKTAVFLILKDILDYHKGNFRELFKNKEELKRVIFEICDARYGGISTKVRRAVIRSVIFILLTKAFFAFGVEGTFERYMYGSVQWPAIIINMLMAPIIMLGVSVFIKAPGKDNSERIFNYINLILSQDNPKLGIPLVIKKNPEKKRSTLETIFTVLWFTTYILTFGGILYILTRLHFNIVSQGVFAFFLAIVSFLCYRISQTANVFTVAHRQSAKAIIADFLFMPFIQVGRRFTEGISQINIFLFLLDFVIEAPFKGMFAFFEQWFLFLQNKREKLE